MQRTKEELQEMTHDELVARVLEMQDILKEGLAVRDQLHVILNNLLLVKANEVERYAELDADGLDEDGLELKQAWALARRAVSNPYGLTKL